MSHRIAISSNKNGLVVAEGLLLRAAAGLGGDSNDWAVSGSVRQSKNHLAECEWIGSIWVENWRLDDWYSEANLTTLDRIWMDGNGLSSPVPYNREQYTLDGVALMPIIASTAARRRSGLESYSRCHKSMLSAPCRTQTIKWIQLVHCRFGLRAT